ncbi:hypothetical protein Bca4012_042618 [Brassica carinata]
MTTQRNINQTRFLIQVPATGSKGYDSRLQVRVQAQKPITNQNERRIVAKEKREQDLVRGLKGVKLASSLLPGHRTTHPPISPPR